MNLDDLTVLIRDINRHFDHAVVVGGAVRDVMLDKPVNDIDIVVLSTVGYHGRKWLKKHGFVSQVVQPVSEYVTTERFLGTYNGFNIDIFFRTDISDLLEFLNTFDVGLCQIGYDGSQVVFTPHYYNDAKNKTLTVVNNTFHTDVHRAKLSAKFPDHRWTRV